MNNKLLSKVLKFDFESLFKRLGYIYFTKGDYNLNIIGIRSNQLDQSDDEFNDIFCYIYKENGVTTLIFDDAVEQKREKNQWLGNLHHFGSSDTCRFDDINLFRLMGKDTIHLEQVIITNHDNVIILRKFFGNTKIIVPVDVAVSLKVNNLYGELQFLDQPVYELRNESISLTTPDFKRAHKSVKIVLSTFLGNVEVVRK